MARKRVENRRSSAPSPEPAAFAAFAGLPLPQPVALPPHCYCPAHVEVRLKGAQPRALKQLLFALQAQGVAVKTPADVVKWLIDQAAVAYADPKPDA